MVKITPPCYFKVFLQQKDQEYQSALAKITLFDVRQIQSWTGVQKQHFAAILYHLRAHIINFIWYYANSSTDDAIKQRVINSIQEELGGERRFFQDLLYEQFAQECGINITREILEEKYYFSFAKEFNQTYLEWLEDHDSDEITAAFAAYEHLHSLEYPYLHSLVHSLNLSPKALQFFHIDKKDEYFEVSFSALTSVWQKTPEKIISTFQFIYAHQLQMWKDLNNTLMSIEALIE